jgi:hypothetical protein
MGAGGDLIKVGDSGEAGDALVSSPAQPMRFFGGAVPAILVRLGEPGLLRFLEFFTVNISNFNTRAAYARAARSFLRWCEGRGLAELKEVSRSTSRLTSSSSGVRAPSAARFSQSRA